MARRRNTARWSNCRAMLESFRSVCVEADAGRSARRVSLAPPPPSQDCLGQTMEHRVSIVRLHLSAHQTPRKSSARLGRGSAAVPPLGQLLKGPKAADRSNIGPTQDKHADVGLKRAHTHTEPIVDQVLLHFRHGEASSPTCSWQMHFRPPQKLCPGAFDGPMLPKGAKLHCIARRAQEVQHGDRLGGANIDGMVASRPTQLVPRRHVRVRPCHSGLFGRSAPGGNRSTREALEGSTTGGSEGGPLREALKVGAGVIWSVLPKWALRARACPNVDANGADNARMPSKTLKLGLQRQERQTPPRPRCAGLRRSRPPGSLEIPKSWPRQRSPMRAWAPSPRTRSPPANVIITAPLRWMAAHISGERKFSASRVEAHAPSARAAWAAGQSSALAAARSRRLASPTRSTMACPCPGADEITRRASSRFCFASTTRYS